jgi:hypothetical protein
VNSDNLPEPLGSALPAEEFLQDLASTLEPHGFDDDNTLVALSTCRDEMTQRFTQEVDRRFGPPFSHGGLAGLPSGGSTAWVACLSHVPDDGRGKLLAVGLAHVGLEADGSTGSYHRPWMRDSAPTCGALGVVLGSWDDPDPQEPVSDHELHVLRAEMAALGGRPPDMLAATMVAADVILGRLVSQISAQDPWDRMDVAVVSGIQVHTMAGVGSGDRFLATGGGLLDADGLHPLWGTPGG